MTMQQDKTDTLSHWTNVLSNENCIKLAGIDIDGQLRGKLISKSKFLSLLKASSQTDNSISNSSGPTFGFCSVLFGWDLHDQTYFKELGVSNQANGYRDILAEIDLSSFRRIPWEGGVPFFLVHFRDPDTHIGLHACPRSLLERMILRLGEQCRGGGWKVMAGAEYEFYNFKSPQNPESKDTIDLQQHLATSSQHSLQPITGGMTGYSLTAPLFFKDYFYDIFNTCERFDCEIEGWHAESGPGVFEAALKYDEISKMADKAALFKYVVKSTAIQFGVQPCFMAKPREGLPGNSGHVHVSLEDEKGHNLFSRTEQDENAPYADLAYVSTLGQQFLAGILEGLPDVMPILAPTINSYKRLVENFWAPVTVSWGLEHRGASIRVIAPPTANPQATRFEIRVAGADANPHLVLAAILGLGLRGIQRELTIRIPPLGKSETTHVGNGDTNTSIRLAKTLKEATATMMRSGSIAREVFGDAFVDHFGGTREHEVKLWEEAVTDWEVKRYMQTV